MVILNATASGNPAIRDNQTGVSHFIEELCNQFERRQKRTINQEMKNIQAFASLSRHFLTSSLLFYCIDNDRSDKFACNKTIHSQT